MDARQLFAGLRWTTGAAAISLIAQLFFVAVLARKLDPAAFGVLLMAMIASRFVSIFSQMGGAQTLIQSPSLSPGLSTASLLLATGVSSLLCLLLIVLAPAFAWYFQTPDLTSVLRVYAWVLPLTAIGALPLALLRRQGRFQASSSIDVVAYVLGYGVTGVVLAQLGYGVWSLVVATLTQQGLALVLGFASARYPLHWPVPPAAWRQALGNGAGYSLIGFLEFLWANVETLLIGRLLGKVSLGLFNRAQMLCNLPVEQLVNTISKVLFPTLSSMQNDKPRMADGFVLMLLVTGVLSVALSAGIAAAAPDVVALLLGPKWHEAAPLVQVIALGVPAMFMYVACGITLDSLAALRAKFKLQAVLLVLKVCAVLLASRWGLLAMVGVVAVCELARTACGVWLLRRLLALDTALLLRVLLLVLAVGVAVYGSVWLLGRGLAAWGWPLALRLPAELATALLAALTVLLISMRSWMHWAPLRRFESLRLPLARLHGRAMRLGLL
jgi:lipopolysaccharide exporter